MPVVGMPRGQTTERRLVIVLLFAAFGLRLHALTVQDIWWDEARNIDVALRPFLNVASALELDIHPPVYFWLLHVWGWISGAGQHLAPVQLSYLMRSVSVLAGVAGVALLSALTRILAGRFAAILAALIGAFSPFWLAESQETRMYTLGFALLIGASLFFMKALPTGGGGQGAATQRRPRWAFLAGFSVLSATALTTHYNAVFVLVAWYLWWGVFSVTRKKGERLREIGTAALFGIATVALVLPAAPIAMRQIPGYANPNLTVPSIAEYLWQNWQAYIGGYAFGGDMIGGFGTAWLWAVFGLLAAGLGVHLSRSESRGDRGDRIRFSFVLFWLAGGLALYYLAVVDRGAFNVRYSSFVTPALYSLMAIAVAACGRRQRYYALLAVALLAVGFVPGIRADLYDDRFAHEDIAGVTEWLRRHAGPNDLILVDQKYPFGYYYERYSIDPDDEPDGREAAPARYLFVDINNVDARLNEWATDVENIYWVQWFESDTDPRRAVTFLLDKEGERQGEEWFRGYSIDWWSLEPPNEFWLAPTMQTMIYQFGDAVRTIEASIPQGPLEPGAEAPVVVRWERVHDGHVDRPLKARVALYDNAGGRIAQTDQRILNDRHLLAGEWSMEDTPLNVYMVDLPDDVHAGEYEIALLVYDAESLDPLSLLDTAGSPAGLEATLGKIQIVDEK